jgi:hypothetical protein
MDDQPERTDLAWRRTGASTVALSLIGLKLGLDGQAAHVVAGAVAALAAVGFAVLAYRRSGELVSGAVPTAMRPVVLAAVTATLLAVEAAGLALVLLPT